MLTFSLPERNTESDIAESFVSHFQSNIRFDHKRNRFLVWDTNYWKESLNGEINRLFLLYSNLLMDEEDKKIRDIGLKIRSRSKTTNILSLAQNILPVSISGNEFDTQADLFGVANGIINLRTSQLREGNQNDYISMKSPIAYNKDAQCPRWTQFINEIFLDDFELIHYVHKALGYSLTASMKEQVFFLCFGEGLNGKSVFSKVIKHLFGDYAYNCSEAMFKKSLYMTQTNDLAEIERKRLVLSIESIKGGSLNDERIKQITGGDEITARLLHQNNFSFIPVCKVWLSTNNLPSFDDDSFGMKRRIKVIPFNYRVPDDKIIQDYEDILLKEEAPGILNWLIEGARFWYQEGLQPEPPEVLIATREYEIYNNPINEYIDSELEKDDEQDIQARTLFHHYLAWAKKTNHLLISETLFGRKMNDLGYEKIRKPDAIYYKGLVFKDLIPQF